MSARPNWWLLRPSTAQHCETWRASPKRSTPSVVPSPWEQGSRVSAPKETQVMRTSPTSRWSPTACQVSKTEAWNGLIRFNQIMTCFCFVLLVYLFVCMFNVHTCLCVCVCVPVVSVSIDDESSPSSSSEDEAANCASSSPQTPPFPSSPTDSTPLGTPCPYPLSSHYSPCSYRSSSPSSSCLDALDLASPCSSQDADSVCGSGHVSPLLGPRSQCSGASSPDCDQERGVCHYISVWIYKEWLFDCPSLYCCFELRKKMFECFLSKGMIRSISVFMSEGKPQKGLLPFWLLWTPIWWKIHFTSVFQFYVSLTSRWPPCEKRSTLNGIFKFIYSFVYGGLILIKNYHGGPCIHFLWVDIFFWDFWEKR